MDLPVFAESKKAYAEQMELVKKERPDHRRKMREKLHAKHAATEDHIRTLEEEGRAGVRYTIMMPDMAFLILGLICDIGWVLQIFFGTWFLNGSPGTGAVTAIAIDADLILTLIGIVYTARLGRIHEKEIALRYQKNLSFGLTVLGGIVGIVIGAVIGSAGFLIGGVLNTAGGLPIFLSFKKGIRYGVR